MEAETPSGGNQAPAMENGSQKHAVLFMRSNEDLCKVENLNRDQKLCICLVFLESI